MLVKIAACTSAGSCVLSFATATLPVIQWVAAAIAIAAGLYALFGKKK